MAFISIYIDWKNILHPFKSGGVLHPLKNLYLRRKNGAGCCDVVSLRDFLAPTIYKALKSFKDYGMPSWPGQFTDGSKMTPKQWDEIINKMINSFKIVCDDGRPDFDDKDVNWEEVSEGLKLFGEYYLHLWK